MPKVTVSASVRESVAEQVRPLLRRALDGETAKREAFLAVGVVLARRPKGLTVDHVLEDVGGCAGADLFSKGTASKVEAIARTWIVPGIATTDEAAGVDGGYGLMYDVFLRQVKPGHMTAEAAWRGILDGSLTREGSKRDAAPGTHRMLRVTRETGELFDVHAGNTDTDTVVRALLELAAYVQPDVLAAVVDYPGTAEELARSIRAATVKREARRAA